MKRVTERVADNRTWIVWDGHIAVATVTIHRTGSPALWTPAELDTEAVYLHRLVVRRSYAGDGFGAELTTGPGNRAAGRIPTPSTSASMSGPTTTSSTTTTSGRGSVSSRSVRHRIAAPRAGYSRSRSVRPCPPALLGSPLGLAVTAIVLVRDTVTHDATGQPIDATRSVWPAESTTLNHRYPLTH